MTYKRKITGVQQSCLNKNNANQMRNIAIQQKGQVQEVQVAVKDVAQEAQEARVNCEEANVSQKLLLKDVEKKVKMKVKMKKKKFCSLLPNKKPYKPNKPHLFNKPNNAKWPNKPNKPHLFNKSNKAKRPNKPNKPYLFNKPNKAKRPNKPNNCLPKSIHYNNFNNFNFNKASKAKQLLLVAKCLPPHHLHRYSSTQMTEKSLY